MFNSGGSRSCPHSAERGGEREKEIKREGEGNREGIREQEQGKWHECVYVQVKESEIIFIYFLFNLYLTRQFRDRGRGNQ